MSLPLKAKVAIRDYWEKPESAVQKSISELHKLLGLEVRCHPEWTIIVSELESVYDDKEQLIKSTISMVKTWFDVVIELLDDSKHEDWTEKLLEMLAEASSRLTLFIEVSESDQASTSWSSARSGFTILLPKATVHQAAQFITLFKDQLLESFQEKSASKSMPIHSTTGDEWADVGIDEAGETTAKSEKTKSVSQVPVVEYLTDPNALPKPSTLLLQPPYHLFINLFGNNKMEVQCSHSGTLDVLSEYLKKWCRINPNLTSKVSV
ncbi:hypothetical protein G7046_g2656 [Stylonectria norvegica]|nr:hypothetical protein G7046_g2656 [Stylonectria norvegica]